MDEATNHAEFFRVQATLLTSLPEHGIRSDAGENRLRMARYAYVRGVILKE